MVECEARRSDFLRDQKKWHRLGTGRGNRRFYLAPPGLVRLDERPDGRGRFACEPKRLKVLRDSSHRPERNWLEEMKHLAAENRRGTPNPEPFLFVERGVNVLFLGTDGGHQPSAIHGETGGIIQADWYTPRAPVDNLQDVFGAMQ